MTAKPKGWRGEPKRHSIAAKKGARTKKGRYVRYPGIGKWKMKVNDEGMTIYLTRDGQILLYDDQEREERIYREVGKKYGFKPLYGIIVAHTRESGKQGGMFKAKTAEGARQLALNYMRKHPNG
jgi:hypothetical protein